MKSLLAATALSLSVAFAAIPSTASARSPVDEQMQPGKSVKRHVQSGKSKAWKKGAKYQGGGQAVANPGKHNLKTPAKGKRWGKEGSNVLLIDEARGTVESVHPGR